MHKHTQTCKHCTLRLLKIAVDWVFCTPLYSMSSPLHVCTPGIIDGGLYITALFPHITLYMLPVHLVPFWQLDKTTKIKFLPTCNFYVTSWTVRCDICIHMYRHLLRKDEPVPHAKYDQTFQMKFLFLWNKCMTLWPLPCQLIAMPPCANRRNDMTLNDEAEKQAWATTALPSFCVEAFTITKV